MAERPAVVLRADDDPGDCDLLKVPADASEDRLAIALRLGRPLVVTGCRSAREVGRLAARLAVVEASLTLADGTTRLAILLDDPAAVLDGVRIATASTRLFALGLDEEALARRLGLSRHDESAAPLRAARGTVALAAAASGLMAVLRPLSALSPALAIETARADGFAVALLPAPRAAMSA